MTSRSRSLPRAAGGAAALNEKSSTAPTAAAAVKKSSNSSSNNSSNNNNGPFLLNEEGDFTGLYKQNTTTASSSSAAGSKRFASTSRLSIGASESSMMMMKSLAPGQQKQQQQQLQKSRAADLSDSDDESPAMSATLHQQQQHMASSSIGQGQQQQQQQQQEHVSTLKKQRELTQFEQKRMAEAAERQKTNIMHAQTVRGVEFKGSAFKASVAAVRFDDFTMNTAADVLAHTQKVQGLSGGGSTAAALHHLKDKSYSISVTFTNVSLAAASLRPDPVPRDVADCLIVHFTPCGMVSPGMSTSATITFAPKEMANVDTELSFTTSTGKLLLPVVCRIPKLTVAVSTRCVDFDAVTVGTARERKITVSNTGSLGTAFTLQGELLDDIARLRHPTLGEMILGRRKRLLANDGESQSAATSANNTMIKNNNNNNNASAAAAAENEKRAQEADEAGWDEQDELWFGEEDEDALDSILEQEENEQEQKKEERLLQDAAASTTLSPARIGTAPSGGGGNNNNRTVATPPSPFASTSKRGKSPITSGRGGGTTKLTKAEEEALRAKEQEEAAHAELQKQRAEAEERSKEQERQRREEKKQRLLRKRQLATSRSHQVLSFVETSSPLFDAAMIDDLLHGEPIPLPPNSSVTITLRFHPTVMMAAAGGTAAAGKPGLNSSFFVAFESDAVADVPVLVKGSTQELPVAISEPTDVVANHCGYYGVQYRSEVTIENKKNVSVRVTPQVPPRWRDCITFTPSTAVTQPLEKFTFRVKLMLPADKAENTNAETPTIEHQQHQQQQAAFTPVLFHVLFHLADESLPLILFVSGKFCRSSLIITPQSFSFGALNEREFSSRTVSVFNPGLLPRSVCVHDFPPNVTVSPKTVVSAAALRKSMRQHSEQNDEHHHHHQATSTTKTATSSVQSLKQLAGKQHSSSATTSAIDNNHNNKTNMLILPGERFEFEISMRPPDPPAPGILPTHEWTDTVTLRCDDDARVPISISGTRRKPPLEFSSPFLLLPRCAVFDVVSVSVLLKNKTSTRRSFSFATLHPKLGVRVSPISGDIEPNGSVVVVVEFHAHSSIVETLPLIEPELRPTEAELQLQQALPPAGGLDASARRSVAAGGGPSAAAASAAAATAANKQQKRTKQEDEDLVRAVLAAEDLRKRCAAYCEAVSSASRRELQEVQPWEQAEDDEYRVSRLKVGPSDSVIELFAALSASSSSSSSSDSLSSNKKQLTLSELPVPQNATQSLFACVPVTAYQHSSVPDSKSHQQQKQQQQPQFVEPSSVFTRTVVIPCHVQGWSEGSSWIDLSVRCTVVPPTIVAESQTTRDLLEQQRAEKLKESQAIRMQMLEQEVATAATAGGGGGGGAGGKPRTPRGGASGAAAAAAKEAEAVAAAQAKASAEAKATALAAAIPRSLQYQKSFKDSHVLIAFPPTASITGRSTNSVRLSFSPQHLISLAEKNWNSSTAINQHPHSDPDHDYLDASAASVITETRGGGGGGPLHPAESTLTSPYSSVLRRDLVAPSGTESYSAAAAVPPRSRRVFITVSPLDPHGPFDLLVPPRTELCWQDEKVKSAALAGIPAASQSQSANKKDNNSNNSGSSPSSSPSVSSTAELTFSFRPRHSAKYRVEGHIVISDPHSGVVHRICLRLEGEGLPTSFAVSCDKGALLAEAATAAALAGAALPAGQRPTSARGGGPGAPKGSGASPMGVASPAKGGAAGGGGNNTNNNNNIIDMDGFSRFAIPVVSLRRGVPALRLSLGHALVGSARSQETVYVLNRSSFPVTCRFDVAAHRCAPSTDSGGVLPFAVEPSALHLAPFAVGEAVVSCATLSSGTFLAAIRVTTSEKAGGKRERQQQQQQDNSNAGGVAPEDDEGAEKIQSESELLTSCCVWDYPVFALLPSPHDAALSATQLTTMVTASAATAAAAAAQAGKTGANNNNNANNSSQPNNSKASGEQQPQQQPLWILPPHYETRLKELSLASGLELSVVSRKQKKQSSAQADAFQALAFSAATLQINPLLSGGGANVLSIVSAAALVGGVPSSAISSIPTSSSSSANNNSSSNAAGSTAAALANNNSSNNNNMNIIFSVGSGILATTAQRVASTFNNSNNINSSAFLLHLANAQNPYGRDLYFGSSSQPGSSRGFPLLLHFVTTMDGNTSVSFSAPGAGGGGARNNNNNNNNNNNSSSINSSTSTIVSSVLAAEKSALLAAPTGSTSSSAKKAGMNSAGAQAAMSQPVAPAVGHQIVVGHVRNTGSSIPSGITAEFSVEGSVLDQAAARQGWKVEPIKGTVSVASNPLQRLTMSFTPTAALVNALPVPGVSVSSSVDMTLVLRFGAAEPQTVHLRLVGQVKRN